MTPTAWDADAVNTFARHMHLNPMGPLASPLEVMAGAHLYEYADKNQRALVAVRPVAFHAGNRLDIVGLESTGDRLEAKNFTLAMDDLARAHQAQYLACLTQQPHVAKACIKNGYVLTGAVLLKLVGGH